ncbi:MAG: argininosuccinate lyase [Ignavibacteriae bacterium]|nr:MAG: argininosuccinate lyase [Ignavibacteriota bacterium]
MLWGSRFEENFDKEALKFSSSLSFDINLIEWDIKVNKAHANMLTKINILSNEENQKIQNGLDNLLIDYKNKNWEPDSDIFEDIHSAIENELTNKIGDIGKKLHTGKSRNDQVITDVRLWTKSSIQLISLNLIELQKSLLKLAEDNIETIMPGYTHLQRAQPISLAFHLLAYVEMFERDKKRFNFTFTESDESILGCGALAGSTINLDREFTAKELGFSKISGNALDGVANRDFILDFLHSCNLAFLHLSRFCEELILWISYEWQFVKLNDKFTTGSSLMPQKQNPDIAELIRGKTGKVYGNYFSLLTILKSLPLSYNRDLQEDKEGLFDSFLSLNSSLQMIKLLIDTIIINKKRFKEEINGSFMLATDLADYLVLKQIPFREAYNIIGKIVKYATEKNKKLNELSIKEYQNFSNKFEEDVFNFLSVEKCLQNKKTTGSPNPELVKARILELKNILSN